MGEAIVEHIFRIAVAAAAGFTIISTNFTTKRVQIFVYQLIHLQSADCIPKARNSIAKANKALSLSSFSAICGI